MKEGSRNRKVMDVITEQYEQHLLFRKEDVDEGFLDHPSNVEYSLSVQDAARAALMSEGHIRTLISTEKLHAKRLRSLDGRLRWYISKRDLDEYLKKPRRVGRPRRKQTVPGGKVYKVYLSPEQFQLAQQVLAAHHLPELVPARIM